jgi:hypothetical protein
MKTRFEFRRRRLWSLTAPSQMFCFWLLFGVGAATGDAAVIFDNGSPDWFDGHGSDFDVFNTGFHAQIADDFSLQPGSGAITGITWWGDYSPTQTPQPLDSFTIRIFSDAGGTAALNPLETLSINGLTRTATGQKLAGKFDVYEYTATVAPVALSPNTPYWLSIVNDTSVDSDDGWYWATSSWLVGNGLIRNWGDGTAWRSIITRDGAEEAFQLTSGDAATPEPSSLILFGIGFVGFGLRRARQRSLR